MALSFGFNIQNLSITAPNGQRLLCNANLDVKPGEIILLLGRIGSGKSTILQLLSGLVPVSQQTWSVSGTLAFGERQYDLSRERPTLGGYVFQQYAIFDELSARNNVAIARDHARSATDVPQEIVISLMADFVHDEREAHQYSGGQKQSIAITRTLFSGHPAMFYDEPNSGLDLHQTQQLGALIQEIARTTQRPAIIVAHHFQHLLPYVDRVLAIDSEQQSLCGLPAQTEEIDRFFYRVPDRQAPGVDDALAIGAGRSLPLRWAWWYFRHYFTTLLFSPTMVLYMLLCGLLTGFVSTWFLFQHFPFREFLTPLLHDNTVQALGFVQLRVLVPLLTALLIASRNSAIISADLGHRMHSQQIDAMTNLHIPYHWYLTGSVVLNMVLASLVFILFNFALSAWASMITWQYLHPLQSTAIWKEAFYGRIVSPGDVLFAGAGWVGLKMALSGLATGLFGVAFGMTKKETVLDLNRGIAQAIIWSASAVLLIHAASALMEF